MLSRFVHHGVKRTLPWTSRPMWGASFSSAAPTLGHGKGKTSTGIVGLPADPDAVSKIITSYQALLDRMAASDLPDNAQYRVDVEKIARYRIKVAMENPDDPDLIEDLCQGGQVEELVEQAKDEMTVLEMYLKERLWEAVGDAEIDHNPTGFEEEVEKS